MYLLGYIKYAAKDVICWQQSMGMSTQDKTDHCWIGKAANLTVYAFYSIGYLGLWRMIQRQSWYHFSHDINILFSESAEHELC